MKLLMGLGKALALLFWVLVAFDLSLAVARPFGGAIEAVAVALLALHLVQLWVYRAELGSLRARLTVLLLGSFASRVAPVTEDLTHA